MSEEIQQAIQIIRLAYDGIEIAIKIGSGSLEQMKQAVDFLIALLKYEKTMGKTSMRKLLLKGGDLQVLQFASEDIKQVKKMAKKYGVLYSIIPKTDKKDNLCEIIFHTEAIPRVNMMVQKLKLARIVNFDEYLNSETKDKVEKQTPFLGESFHTENMSNHAELIKQIGEYICEKQNIQTEKIKEHFSITTEQVETVLEWLRKMGVWERGENDKPQIFMKKEDFLKIVNEYQALLQRIHHISAIQKGNLIEITIPKNQITEENEHAIKIQMPSIRENEENYIWIKKENAMDIQNGRNILTFLDMDKEYKIYTKDNRILGTKKGDVLYEEYYDKIEQEIRKHYKKTERKTIVKSEKKSQKPKKR